MVAKPSHARGGVDGLAYPLCSRQARGQDFLSDVVSSHRVAVGGGALIGDARPLDLDTCGGVDCLGTCMCSHSSYHLR
jgi:hypothetical protein